MSIFFIIILIILLIFAFNRSAQKWLLRKIYNLFIRQLQKRANQEMKERQQYQQRTNNEKQSSNTNTEVHQKVNLSDIAKKKFEDKRYSEYVDFEEIE